MLLLLVKNCVLCDFQTRGEDQDPGEESERADRRELHRSQPGLPAAGQFRNLIYLFGSMCCGIGEPRVVD